MLVYAKAHSDHEETGDAEVRPLSSQERFSLFAIRTGIFVFLAVAAIFIPILHFILVPGFLIAAVFAGLSASGLKEKLIAATVTCPHCKAKITVKETPLKWPLMCVCQSCASSVRLYPQSQKAII